MPLSAPVLCMVSFISQGSTGNGKLFSLSQQRCRALCMPANQWHGFNLWEGKSGQDPPVHYNPPTVCRVAWKCTGWHGGGGRVIWLLRALCGNI